LLDCDFAGFLRDWLIRGETANDVDCLVTNVQQKKSIIIPVLQTYLGGCTQKQKGAAWTLVFNFQGHELEMDLLDPSTQPKTAPGVDCDVGNFAFDQKGLKLKIGNPNLVSLSKAIKHCQTQKFVFYRQLPQNSEHRRLTKYMNERGWTCKSAIPDAVVQQLGLPQHLLKPKLKYSKLWWTF
jgi:hypothetical protein